MDIESIKDVIKDIIELVKDNLKPYLITLAIVFALASGISDYDWYGLSGFIVHYPLCLLAKLYCIMPMSIVVAVFYAFSKLDLGFRGWIFFLGVGILFLSVLGNANVHMYIPLISEIAEMDKELARKILFVIFVLYYFLLC